MTRRILAALFGAVLFGLLSPLAYLLLVGGDMSLLTLVWLAVLGVVVGSILGALFPRVFGFVFELFMDV